MGIFEIFIKKCWFPTKKFSKSSFNISFIILKTFAWKTFKVLDSYIIVQCIPLIIKKKQLSISRFSQFIALIYSI